MDDKRGLVSGRTVRSKKTQVKTPCFGKFALFSGHTGSLQDVRRFYKYWVVLMVLSKWIISHPFDKEVVNPVDR